MKLLHPFGLVGGLIVLALTTFSPSSTARSNAGVRWCTLQDRSRQSWPPLRGHTALLKDVIDVFAVCADPGTAERFESRRSFDDALAPEPKWRDCGIPSRTYWPPCCGFPCHSPVTSV
jgi:hypothetical protein